MSTFVLVHGGAHGGWCFQPLARILREHGHDVYTPTLTGLGERAHLFRADVDLDCHINDIVAVLHYEDLRNAILVGHSYGGVVITGAADRAPDRVAHRVYLDTMEPKDGQSLVDIAGPFMSAAQLDSRIIDGVQMCLFPSDETLPFYGVTDPDTLSWMRERLTPHPWRCFEQPLTLTNSAALQSIPQSHISTTTFMSLRNVDRLREKADGRVWDIDTGHDLMITEPHKVAELLDRVAVR
ncbi:alpha/beta hydrolase [Mycobacterium sp. 1274761.0]|uniref:alpha/beta hydrolase n=1 Tax=Mycobacterium sp. 1274761.0 TaxID=1834077 RepID=UPI0007FCEF68|nr:alpha/beta hydrolase [Mycobacterium sp. 1274761.0]OBK72407.1 esterase [Mycobacterium sp. 1274761.0]